VRGDPDHPANRGRLCSKGTHLGETMGLEQRLLHPVVEGARTGWAEALDLVARRFAETIAAHGPESVAFYVSGQLLTEDYYVANKLMKGFIGSGNIDTNSRLCMASAVAAHKRAFGEDVVPACYDDLEAADLVLLVGSNAAWCHPVLFQRLAAARQQRGTRIVVIDPRRTESCAIADLHLPLRPGSDVALFNGLLGEMARRGALDATFLARHVDQPQGWIDTLAGIPFDQTAAACALPRSSLDQLAGWLAATPRTLTLFSQGVNQSSQGTDKASAIINLHLATGRIGKPGAAPFSLTGQPNAMGGREVGGLANQLAAHMDFDAASIDRIRRFWSAPAMATQPGLKAVDLFEAVRSGQVKALWIMATNPAVSLPQLDRVHEALAVCPFVVVSDCSAATDTLTFADVALPAAAWAEKSGTVTNSERRISRQRALCNPPGEARPDWWIIARVAARMGYGAAFDYASPAAIYREHAALSAFENDGRRLFDIGAHAALGDADYDRLVPVQWPLRTGAAGPSRLFADGRFATADGRARLVAVEALEPAGMPDTAFPLRLNTGRMRDQWHTMTRTGLSPRLARHSAEPHVDVATADAALAGLVTGDLARVSTPFGSGLYRVAVGDAQRPGDLFVPIHWSRRTSGGGLTGALCNAALDPVSGQPEFKHTPARIARVDHDWGGFVVSRAAIATDDLAYWTRVRLAGGWLYEFATDLPPDRLAAKLLPPLPDRAVAQMRDHGRGIHRFALVDEGQLAACLFVAAGSDRSAREWLAGLLAREAPVSAVEILAGRPAGGGCDAGPQVCACFNVGRHTIETAIHAQKLTTVEAIGATLNAGANCGSCRPALATLLAAAGAATAPAAAQ